MQFKNLLNEKQNEFQILANVNKLANAITKNKNLFNYLNKKITFKPITVGDHYLYLKVIALMYTKSNDFSGLRTYNDVVKMQANEKENLITQIREPIEVERQMSLEQELITLFHKVNDVELILDVLDSIFFDANDK